MFALFRDIGPKWFPVAESTLKGLIGIIVARGTAGNRHGPFRSRVPVVFAGMEFIRSFIH